jgi:hypothetical protein
MLLFCTFQRTFLHGLLDSLPTLKSAQRTSFAYHPLMCSAETANEQSLADSQYISLLVTVTP